MRKLSFVFMAIVLALGSVVIALPANPVQAQGTTFTVTSTDDPGDGVCDGNCTLREAIDAANANPGNDTIAFNISGAGPHTIQPTSALPTISDPVIIDGYTQPGASPNTNPVGLGTNAVLKIELNGSLAGTSQGLYITADNTTVRGLVINRFGSNGIFLLGNGGNHIEGSFIGTNVTGTAGLANGASGVFLQQSMDNTIGGTTPAARNLISGNTAGGIGISGDQATGNLVQGNLIGTDSTGMINLGNGYDGVGIIYGSNNTVGGTTPGAGNVICGNTYAGVEIQKPEANANVVQGNLIGTDVTGTNKLGNGQGVVIGGAQENIIGGTTVAARNIISGNDGNGVAFYGNEATGNLVQGNFIGTDVNGTVDLRNSGDGVVIFDATNNTIGGTTVGAGNVISGNNRGVTITHPGATGNIVQGNFIGTDVSGTADLGNSGDGVHIWSASSNTIGGTAVGARNIISGNDRDGVVISDTSATGNVVQGNFIGTDVNGTSDLGNSINGVWIIHARNNTIGGATAGAGNTIAFNTGDGVFVSSGTGNAILSNSVFSNAGLGIDLSPDGVTPNDPGDGDTGANDLQNFPVLISATSGSTTIEGTFNTTPNTEFRLECFSNSACDPSGHGEGEAFLGSTLVTTDGSGNASFTVTFPDTVPTGQFITATATDPGNNTSEFSQCVQVTAEVQPVEATVDFDPDTLNLKSGGKVGSSEISIQAYIDGRSLLIITGNTVQWHHLDWAAPGRLDFVNLPTIINGIEWYPQWADEPDEENRWCNCNSSIYEDLDPALPKLDVEVELNIIQARHSLSIAEYPSVDNDYTLIVDFNDNPPGGAAWYECELVVTWQTTSRMHSKAPVTVYIELPESYDVEDIDVSTVTLNDTVPALAHPTEVGDYDSDGVPDLMVKFNRSDVIDILEVGEEIVVTIAGEVAGIPFEGSDTIRVID